MITSRGNARIRRLSALKKKGSERSAEDAFLVEGIKMFREIPPGLLLEVYVSESFLKTEAGREAVRRAEEEAAALRKPGEQDVQFETVSDGVFEGLSDTQSPQGVMAVVRQRHYRLEDLLGETGAGEPARCSQPLILILENLQDPGNLGTMIRTAEGAGATGIVMTRGTADLYSPKVTRATMGSIFRMPYLYTDDLPGTVGRLKREGVTVCAAHLSGRSAYDGENYTGGTAFLIGNESRGLSSGVAELADVRVRIPMEGQVESLNASVAAAILLYEASRQRRHAQSCLHTVLSDF